MGFNSAFKGLNNVNVLYGSLVNTLIKKKRHYQYVGLLVHWRQRQKVLRNVCKYLPVTRRRIPGGEFSSSSLWEIIISRFFFGHRLWPLFSLVTQRIATFAQRTNSIHNTDNLLFIVNVIAINIYNHVLLEYSRNCGIFKELWNIQGTVEYSRNCGMWYEISCTERRFYLGSDHGENWAR